MVEAYFFGKRKKWAKAKINEVSVELAKQENL